MQCSGKGRALHINWRISGINICDNALINTICGLLPRYVLVWWSLTDIHTLTSIPGTVRIPGEDTLPTALVIGAVS